jgi:predicted ATPase/class 3 adenylate cyclase
MATNGTRWQDSVVGALPSGTVTFMFTDLEDSTRLWEEHPEAMRSALARHDELVRAAVEEYGGGVVKGTGDGLYAAFATAHAAVAAATAAQQRLTEERWEDETPLRARMGMHSGEAELRDGDYFGSVLNRAARLMGAAHGGQIVCSQTTADLARDSIPDGLTLKDLGDHGLRGFSRPERVFQVCAPGLESTFPPLRTGDHSPGSLPRQMTTFVGRDTEIDLIATLVSSQPVVTLTGVGGVGKTRLAVEVAEHLRDAFPDGAWLCELAPIGDPDAMWEALAATFRAVPPPGRRLQDVIIEQLAPKRALLVLDNCEHLLDAVARIVLDLVRNCPKIAILATSREGLALPGEQIVAVPSLPLPEKGASGESVGNVASVQLFCDRAHAVKHDFSPTDSTLEAVAQLCRRLDGIPLAIELAAARIASLTPEDLLGRLDQRFRLLTRGSRASLERHQTLRNTIDWSYELLDQSERFALLRLSVFADGADLDATEAVLAAGKGLERDDVVDVVGQLVSKSLVMAEPDEEGHLRYRMLETIRQYAHERLEASRELADVRSAHAGYFVEFVEVMGPRLRGRELPTWARYVERETDNLRMVLDWAVETVCPELALRLIAPLRGHGHTTGYAATEWADTAIEIPGADLLPQFLAVASWAVFGAAMRHDYVRGAEIASRIESMQAERGRTDPTAYWGLGTLAFFQGDLEHAYRLAEEWVAAARVADDGYELSHALVLCASAGAFLGRPGARAQMEDAVQVAREAGALSALSIALSQLCNMLDLHGDDMDRGLVLTDEAITVASQLGDEIAIAVAAGSRATLLALRGDPYEALAVAQRGANALRSSNNLSPLAPLLSAGAIALTELGDFEDAAVLFGATENHAYGSAPEWIQQLIKSTEAVARRELGVEFQTHFDRGRALSSLGISTLLANLDTSPI